jgi:hypothetical protein
MTRISDDSRRVQNVYVLKSRQTGILAQPELERADG